MGASLDDVLTDMELAAGDFVRAMKQLIDVVAQVADASGPGPLRKTAREALDLLRHGVVSYTIDHELAASPSSTRSAAPLMPQVSANARNAACWSSVSASSFHAEISQASRLTATTVRAAAM